MFVGHYGAAFVGKRADASIPLWVLFLAVQFLDVLWAPLVILGIEKVRIVPGITATNPLDLYYMPYTHSLVGAVCWSIGGAALYGLVARPPRWRSMAVVGLAVFSHWVLDLIVHRPDLPLYDNTAKVGLGLWNRPALAFSLEAGFFFGGLALFLRVRPMRIVPLVVFGLLILTIQAYVFFGPPPRSPSAFALTALVAYAGYAAVIWALADRSTLTSHPRPP
jgi:hypothetical protein